MTTFIVTQKAMRPARTERRCFYCFQAIGDFHKDDGVLVRKNVIINFSIDIETSVLRKRRGPFACRMAAHLELIKQEFKAKNILLVLVASGFVSNLPKGVTAPIRTKK